MVINIFNVNIPLDKPVLISLTYIYGIGLSISKYICRVCKIDFLKKAKFLSDLDIKNIINEVSKFKVENDLRKEINNNIKNLINLKCYKGIRHLKKLPVRGQRTRNNSRTRKGPRKILFFKDNKNVKKN